MGLAEFILLTVRCYRCGRPHVSTEDAYRRSPECPFCGGSTFAGRMKDAARPG